MKGWGPKSSVCPSKPGKPNFFGGISLDFAGISRGRPKSLRKKVCVQFSFPIAGYGSWIGNLLNAVFCLCVLGDAKVGTSLACSSD